MSLPSSELLTDSLNFTTDGTTTAAKITATAQTLTLSTGTTLNDPVKLKGIQTPTESGDAANKAYVDSQSGGGGGSPGGDPRNVQFNDGGSLGGATGININTNINLQLDENKKLSFVDDANFIQAIPDWRSSGLSALLFESTQDNIIFEHNNTNGGGGIAFLVQISSSTATPNNFSILANDVNNSTSTLLQINFGEMEVRIPNVKFNSNTVKIEGDNNVEKFKVVKADNLPIFTVNTLDSEIQFPNDVPLIIGDDNNNFIKTQTNYQGITGLDATLLQCNNNILVFDNINPGIPGQEGGVLFILTSDFSTPNPNNAFTITPRNSASQSFGNYMVQIQKGLHEIVNDTLEINVQDTHILGDPSSQKFCVDDPLAQTIFQVNTLDKKVQIPGDEIELTFGPQGTSYIKTVPHWLGLASYPSALQIQNNQGLFVLEHETVTPGVEGGLYFVIDTDPSAPNPDQNVFTVWIRDSVQDTLSSRLEIDFSKTTFYEQVFYENNLIIGQDEQVDKFKVLKNNDTILFSVDTLNDQIKIPSDNNGLNIGIQNNGICSVKTIKDWRTVPGFNIFQFENTRENFVIEHKNTQAGGGGIFFIWDSDPANPTTFFQIFVRDTQAVFPQDLSLLFACGDDPLNFRFETPVIFENDFSSFSNNDLNGANTLILSPNNLLKFEANTTINLLPSEVFFITRRLFPSGSRTLWRVGNDKIYSESPNIIIRPQNTLSITANLEILGEQNQNKLNIPSITGPPDVMNVDTETDITTISAVKSSAIIQDMVIYEDYVDDSSSINNNPRYQTGDEFREFGFSNLRYSRITTTIPWVDYTPPTSFPFNNNFTLQPGTYYIEINVSVQNSEDFIIGIEISQNNQITYEYGNVAYGSNEDPTLPIIPLSNGVLVHSRLQTVLVCNQITQFVPIQYGAVGTPIGNDPAGAFLGKFISNSQVGFVSVTYQYPGMPVAEKFPGVYQNIMIKKLA